MIGDEPVHALAAPLVTEASVLGLLTLVGPEDGAFDEQAARAVGALAGQGAVAIENARLHRLIQKQARTDGLTSLANHREFQEQLAHEVERAQRFGVPVGLVLLDLDDFKMINDRYGHLAGDNVLKAVSGALRGAIRDIDQASRYGGEEFAVILPHTTVEGGARLAERLRQAIAERVANAPDGRQIRITASFGVAGLPGPRGNAGRAHRDRRRGALPRQAERQEPCRRGPPTRRIFVTAPRSGGIVSPARGDGVTTEVGVMTEGRSLFASVIEEHLALKRRNAHLNDNRPIEAYELPDPFDNHALFKSEATARREEEETGEHPAITLEWPVAANTVGEVEEAWLDQQQCQDFDWGD